MKIKPLNDWRHRTVRSNHEDHRWHHHPRNGKGKARRGTVEAIGGSA